MTSSDKIAAPGSDVTTSQSGNVGCEGPETNRSVVVTSQDAKHALKSGSVSVTPTTSVSVLSTPRTSNRQSGNESRNPEACGWLQSIGRIRRKLEEIRPMSTPSTLCRARTVGPMSDRSSGDAASTDSRTEMTTATGAHSAHLRKAAAVGSALRLPAQSMVNSSGVGSPSAVADCRAHYRSASGEAHLERGLLRVFAAAFPGRSRHEAASKVQHATTTSSYSVKPQTVTNANQGKRQSVLGPHRSLTNSSNCSEKTDKQTSTFSATVNSYSTSSCQLSTSSEGQNLQPESVNFGSRASASPQIRRLNYCPESSSRSSTATQADNVDHHHQFPHQQPDNATKPHSVPCSPRLQARLSATPPWRPWSQSNSVKTNIISQTDSPTSTDICQLASSLLLTKVIRDRQSLKSPGIYIHTV